MKAFWNVYLFFFCSILLFSFQAKNSFAQANGRTYKIEELPTAIKKAVRFSTNLQSAHIKTDLNKKSSGHINLQVQLETIGSYYIYEDSVQIEALNDPFLDGAQWKLEIIKTPDTQSFLDPVSKKIKQAYRGQSVFSVQASLSTSISKPLPLEHKIPFRVRFQACSNTQCLLPAWVKLEQQSSNNVANNTKQTLSWSAQTKVVFEKAIEGGNSRTKLILILLLAGLLTAFTPCVYPLYPITLGIFGRWEKTLHFPVIFLVISYCLGMTLSYATLGVFTLATGSLFASITQTPLFLIGIGVLILLSALFFSGLINFPMPLFLQNFASHAGEGAEKKGTFSSLLGAFAMGASLGIVASPCVGPVLVALLAWLSNSMAQGQSSPYEGFILLSAFGAGMSLPFLALGHIILKMKKKIQLGKYTPAIKYIGTALLVVSSLIFIIPGIQLLTDNGANKEDHFSFEVYSLETAPQNSWLLIDFRADWCAACLQLERETFSAEPISTLINNKEWNYVQVDFTNMGEKEQAIAQKYDVLSLPTVLFVSPDGTICKSSSLHEFEKVKEFKLRLENTKTNCN